MSEYDFKNKETGQSSNVSDSMSAVYSADTVSGTSSTNGMDTATNFGASDSYSAFEASNMSSSYAGDTMSALGAANSVEFMTGYGSSAASNSAGSSSSFSMSSGSSSSNCASDGGTCHSLAGVDCKATNCRYHHPGGQCSATNIVVQAPDADNKTDTFCNTFTPNSGY